MAAYAALTSLKYIIHNLQNHPSPPISIDEQQVRSLIEVVSILQEFLRGYSSSFAYSEEADPLERRIADAAYKAEDVIESKIVDQIKSQPTIPSEITREDLHQDLQLVIKEMDLIKKVAKAMHTDNTKFRTPLRSHASSVLGSSTSSSSTSSSMVGFDNALNEVLENLVGSLDLQVIPITGMGGIGKTTLVRNIFENAFVKEHFHIRAWTTISQNYNVPQALKELLSQARANSSGESEDELGLELYQRLSGKRYLIVMDDMWSIEVWDRTRHYFPNYKVGSRVIVTTRQSNLAHHLNNVFNMKFLDEISSWNLFSRTVYGKESFPRELKNIGKKIVGNCGGLPLSIVTIGGLLAKSDRTLEYWEHIEENINSIVNSEDDDYCLRILKISYNYLPVYLKPCYLYMGFFEEDEEIPVATLINMWVSEGFLEPRSEKSLEIIAEENLKDLVDRNLVLVDKLGSNRNMNYCNIHDLLRDLCIREAAKERFYGIVGKHIPQGTNSLRRIFFQSTSKGIIETLGSMPHARSVLIDYKRDEEANDPLSLNLRLLRIALGDYFEKYVFELVNLRFLSIGDIDVAQFTSSLNLFWNLHTLVCGHYECVDAPIEIWNMPHLRHVHFPYGVCLPNPPTKHAIIMENLHTLKIVRNFKLNQEVIKRIPNIKKLWVEYDEILSSGDDYCLNDLECLHKLESFQCFSSNMKVHDFLKKLAFPQSLKKLILVFSDDFELEEMLENIGSLSLLQKLGLYGGFFRTGEWRIGESQFCELEFLTL